MSALTRRTLVRGTAAMTAFAMLGSRAGFRPVHAQGAGYEVIDFGAMTDGVLPEGFARPIFGDVSGVSPEGTVFGRIAVSEEKLSPALWSSSGKLKRLKSGKFGGNIQAINANGDAVGEIYNERGGNYNTNAPAAWIDGELIELAAPETDFPQGKGGTAVGISDDGVIVGQANGNSVRWVDAEPEILTASDGSTRNAAGINGAGVIAASQGGFVNDQWTMSVGRMVGADFTSVDIPTDMIGSYPNIVAINEAGTLLVSAYPFDVALGLLVEDDAVTPIDYRKTGGSFSALALNDKNDVLGLFSPQAGATATYAVWSDGELTDINAMLPSDNTLKIAGLTGINNDGMLCGNAYDPDLVEHLILLVPAS